MTFKVPLANATRASGNKSLQVIPPLYRARSAGVVNSTSRATKHGWANCGGCRIA
jgi:hypothetical protein